MDRRPRKLVALGVTVGHLAILGLILLLNPENRSAPWVGGSSLWAVGIVMAYPYWLARGGGIDLRPILQGWFRLRSWEREAKGYRRLGVPEFRFLLLHSPFAWLNPQLRVRSRSPDALAELDGQMREAEALHLFAAILSVPMAILFALLKHDVAYFAWMTAGNVVLNVYPVLLQRHNRSRLEPILKRARRLAETQLR